jgi:hypothetical protein
MKKFIIIAALLCSIGATQNAYSMLWDLAKIFVAEAVKDKIKNKVESVTGVRPVFNQENSLEIYDSWKRYNQAQEASEKRKRDLTELEQEVRDLERIVANRRELYRIILQRNDDCGVIARNIGWESITRAVERIKQHIFNNSSEPTLEILERWDRLYRNQLNDGDQEWLEQLFAELELESL